MNRQSTLVCILFLLPATVSSQPALTTDYQTARAFLGARKAIAVFSVTPAKMPSTLYYVDFSRSPLSIEMVAATSSAGDLSDSRSVNVSPDGRFVAWSHKGTAYVHAVEKNTTRTFAVGKGVQPTWWIHPVTRKTYILLSRPASPKYTIIMQEVDLNGLTIVGSADTLLSGGWPASQDGGRSPDGRYLMGADPSQGGVELDDPLCLKSARVKTSTLYGSQGGYLKDATLRPWSGYCHGSMSPAQPGHRYHAASAHMGAGHTDLFVRLWPADYNNPGPIDPDHQWLQPNYNGTTKCGDAAVQLGSFRSSTYRCVYVTDTPLVHIKPQAPNKYFQGAFWTTHPDFLTAKESDGYSAAVWYGYLYDVAVPSGSRYVTNVKRLKLLSKCLNRNNDILHMWVEPGATAAVSRTRATAAVGANTKRAVIDRTGKLRISSGSGSISRVVVTDIRGRRIGVSGDGIVARNGAMAVRVIGREGGGAVCLSATN